MNKKLYFAAFAAALAIMGCNKAGYAPDHGTTTDSNAPVGDEQTVQLTVSVSDADPETKITGVINDKKVNTLQVIVFNKHGLYETSAVAADSKVTFSCTAGYKKIVALVNTDTQTNITTYDELSARKASLVGTDGDNCVMVGETESDIASTGSVQIDVKRLASMVVLKSVSTNFGSSYLKNLPFEIKSVYLINAAGERAFIGDDEPALIYNEGAYDSSTSLDTLYDEVTDGTLTSGGLSYDVDHFFYCYPNPSSMKTRLVIEATIDSDTYYYPIELPDLQPNSKYSYSVTIKGLGKDSPNILLTPVDLTASVTVTTWAETSSEVEL